MVESTLVDSTMWVIGEQIARVAAGGQAGWGEAASRRAYRAADGKMITLSAAEPRTWSAFCAGIERADLEPQLYSDATGQDALREELEGIIVTRTAAEWVAHFDGTAAAVGPVLTVEDLLIDDHVVARGSIVDLAHDTETHCSRSDRRCARTRPRVPRSRRCSVRRPRSAPTRTMCCAAAGFDDDEIDALRRDGVIGPTT